MKTCILILISIICTGLSTAQSLKPVYYLHGSAGQGSQMYPLKAAVDNALTGYTYASHLPTMNTANGISHASQQLNIVPSSTVIAHSMGGLVAREHIRQNGYDGFKTAQNLITIATPHLGAEVGDVSNLASLMSQEIAGYAQLYGLLGIHTTDMVMSIPGIENYLSLSQYIPTPYINEQFNLWASNQVLHQSFSDVFSKGTYGSNFTVNQLNSEQHGFLPDRRFSIYGSNLMDPTYTFLPLFDNSGNGHLTYSYSFVSVHSYFMSFMFLNVAEMFSDMANSALQEANSNPNNSTTFNTYTEYMFLYSLFMMVAQDWGTAASFYLFGVPELWHFNVTQAYLGQPGPYNFYENDGLINAATAAPPQYFNRNPNAGPVTAFPVDADHIGIRSSFDTQNRVRNIMQSLLNETHLDP